MKTYSQCNLLLCAGLVFTSVFFISGCSNLDNKKTEKKESVKESSENSTYAVVPVRSALLSRVIELPGELQAFRSVPVHAKVQGYVEWIGVDRGSLVKAGEVIMRVSAPELDARCATATAKVKTETANLKEAEAGLESDLALALEVKAKGEADALNLKRLHQAAKVEGAVAPVEIETAEKTVEGDSARRHSMESKVIASRSIISAHKANVVAAENELAAVKQMRSYLNITAPFDGVITERNVHEGSIVGVDPGRDDNKKPLLKVEDTKRLRLVVSVPEDLCAGITSGATLTFTVPAHLGRVFQGKVSRISYSLERHTRTMPVELDVENASQLLQPGMFANVKWRARRSYKTLFVPRSAIVENMRGKYVARINSGKISLVPVSTGQSMEDSLEVSGPIKEGDQVVYLASDELKEGGAISTRPLTDADKKASVQEKSGGGE